MKILVANLGSTSLKWRLFDCSNGDPALLHRGGIERVTDHSVAIDSCLEQLRQAGHFKGEGDLAAVGFKTVIAQGITGCILLDEPALKAMEAFNPIAPAHNPPYIAGIRLFARRLPDTPLVGLFETAFYQWAPEASMRYAVPRSWLEAGVRRWGFHGASHKYVAERSAQLLGRDDIASRVQNLYLDGGRRPDEEGRELRVISCHLGGTSSITGLRDGIAIGNSLGMSPQSGLPHNNRVGDLDSFAIPFVMRTLGLGLDEVERQLGKESGLKGLSGVSNDIRDIQVAAEKGNEAAQLAIDTFVHGVRHWIGAYLAELNGADALVFTAGIGENRAELRAAICDRLDQLGIILDPSKNADARGVEARIDAQGSRTQIWVIPTNEELVVARETHRLLVRKGAAAANKAVPQLNSQLSTLNSQLST